MKSLPFRDETDWQRRISRYFEEFRALKAQSERAADSKERFALKEAAHEASNQGWALARAFAPLRHAYAITCHKSQGPRSIALWWISPI